MPRNLVAELTIDGLAVENADLRATIVDLAEQLWIEQAGRQIVESWLVEERRQRLSAEQRLGWTGDLTPEEDRCQS